MTGAEIKSFTIRGENGASINGYRDNMGEPFRLGVTLWICMDGEDRGSGVFVMPHEIDELITNLQALRKAR